MNDDFEELFQQFLAQAKAGKNRRVMPGATLTCAAENSLCGDKVTVFLEVNDGQISDASFVSEGCALAQVSSSLLTDHVKGLSMPAAKALANDFVIALSPENTPSALNPMLNIFVGKVRNIPQRRLCVCLPWQALLNGVNTE